MDLSALRQQILLSNKTASEKAEELLLESMVNDLSKDEWRELIAGIPEDVKKEIGRLKSAGTQLQNQPFSAGFATDTGHSIHQLYLIILVLVRTCKA